MQPEKKKKKPWVIGGDMTNQANCCILEIDPI